MTEENRHLKKFLYLMRKSIKRPLVAASVGIGTVFVISYPLIEHYGLILFSINPDWYSNGQSCDLDYDTASEQYARRLKNLGTESRFHNLVRKPTYLSLPFPGYLIGIEGGRYSNFKIISVGFKTPLFISHIGRFQTTGDKENNWTTCFIHNGYYLDGTNYENSVGREGTKGPTPTDIKFTPLIKLGEDIRARFEEGKRPTHIVVMSTGYNTPQWESLANYNELFENMKKAAEADTEGGFSLSEKFRPLFIGISWRSFTPSRLVREGGSKLDFPAAAKRANAIGERLGALLLSDILLQLKRDYDT